MNRTSAILVFAAMLASAPMAMAQQANKLLPGNFSATVGFTTDYVFRGVSQTDNGPAIQGSIDWAHDSGIYAGVWGSNVDFNDGDEANLELDLYAGWKRSFGPATLDLGLLYYAYPGASVARDYDFVEAKLAASYAFGDVVGVTGSYRYSPDYFFESGQAHYLNAAVAVTPGLPLGLAFGAAVGHQWIDDNAVYGAPDYTDWSVSVSASVEGFLVTLAYTDTDLSQGECFGGLDWCDARAVLSVSRSF